MKKTGINSQQVSDKHCLAVWCTYLRIQIQDAVFDDHNTQLLDNEVSDRQTDI